METLKRWGPWILAVVLLIAAIFSGFSCEKIKKQNDELTVTNKLNEVEIATLKRTITELQQTWQTERTNYLNRISELETKTLVQFKPMAFIGIGYGFDDGTFLPEVGYRALKLEYNYKPGEIFSIRHFRPGVFLKL
jgi:hypothetical protein